MTKTLVAMALAVGAFGVIGTARAQASCAMPRSLQEQVASAPLAFVGTVESTSDGDRAAHVKVESIWKGPDLPAYVDVHGSPASGSGAATSVDRRYRSGERDLVVLFSDRPPYQDNSCSATQPYTADLAALAPADARPPAPPTAGEQVHNFLDDNSKAIAIFGLIIAVATYIGRRRLARGSKP